MMEKNQFKENLSKEIQELETLQKVLQLRLSDAPAGTLQICHKNKGKYAQYYICGEDGKRIYIPADKREFARALAQKSYDRQVFAIVQARLRCAGQLLKQYGRMTGEVYSKLSDARKSLVTPILPADEEFVKEWYEKHPGAVNPYPVNSALYSERGEMVRSKSEKILADLFFRRGIPYVYEPQLLLNGRKRVYPDFLLLNVQRRKTCVYEHFGMTDNPEYAQNMNEKLALYMENGYWYGDTLLFSMETGAAPLNTKHIEKMLCRFFGNEREATEQNRLTG